MKIFSPRTLLAAALLTALPMGSALACTVSAWTGAGTATTADNAGGPGDGIARYSGVCGLAVDSGDYVIDNTPGSEAVYRARFYVLTRATSGATIFRATANEDGGGAEVIKVDFNGSAFSFTQNGTAAGSVPGIVADRWYSIELFYKANDTFSAEVAGAATFTGSVAPITTGIGNGTIGSAVLGVAAGTGSNFGFDAFESTRSETTEIGRLCRGDANASDSRTVADAVIIRNEVAGGDKAVGQPDTNEDGQVTTADSVLVRNMVAGGLGACTNP